MGYANDEPMQYMIGKRRPGNTAAFTRTELVVVILILFVVFVVVVDFEPSGKGKVLRISCVINLKQLGTAYGVWAGDHNGRFPFSESVSNGGWKELLTNGDQGANCWTNYAIMADEMGRSTQVVRCPADERQVAGEFIGGPRTAGGPEFPDFKDNRTLSYFVSVSASTPQSLLGGDRNLGGGTEPDRDYGFSPKDGKGNDVAIQTNSSSGPVSWSLKMHSSGNTAGAGNFCSAMAAFNRSPATVFVKVGSLSLVRPPIGPPGTFLRRLPSA